VWHDSFICVTWLIPMCDMTHSYVWHDAIICVTWRIHMCEMTHSYVWHDSIICVTWRIHMCDMSHSYVWHDFCTRHVTRMNETCHTCVCILTKEPYILTKEPHIRSKEPYILLQEPYIVTCHIFKHVITLIAKLVLRDVLEVLTGVVEVASKHNFLQSNTRPTKKISRVLYQKNTTFEEKSSVF